ncbi:MAG: MFS transporter [Granulosicoccus sp.]
MKGLVALALAYVLSQFYRSFLAVLTPQLTQELAADKGDLSLASGVWFISFALMQFVVGIGLDRYGPRRTAAFIFGAGATSGALLFATAQSPVAIVIAMFLFGIGCSPVLMASLFIIAQRFNASSFAVMTSSLVAFGNTGNVIGATPLAAAVDVFGWRETMLGLGAISFIISLAIFALVRDPDVDSTTQAGFKGYLVLLKSRVLWAIMIMTLLCYAPVVSIRGLWAGPYLHDLYQADSLQIGQTTFYMAIAMIVGSLVYGPLDRVFNTRKWVVFTGNLIVLGALMVLVFVPSIDRQDATLVFVTIGLCGTSYGVIMAHGRSFLPTHLIGRGVTLLNFCSIFGAGVMQLASGRLINAQTQPDSPESYQLLFGFYALILSLALLLYAFSRDARPQPDSVRSLSK